MSYKNKSYSQYQKEYRETHKEKAKKYQEEYREKKFIQKRLKSLNETVLETDFIKYKSRIYICQVGDDRLKIGATFRHSNRIYHVKRLLKLIGIDLVPLFYYDCLNEQLIKDIEKELKVRFCSRDYGFNVNSLKREISHICNLENIKYFIMDKFESAGVNYEITVL